MYLIVLCVVYFVYMSKPVSLHGQIKLCVRVLQVKPLGVIWGKYREFYNKKNTIMFDDIGRNFLMNPQNGLKVGKMTFNPSPSPTAKCSYTAKPFLVSTYTAKLINPGYKSNKSCKGAFYLFLVLNPGHV